MNLQPPPFSGKLIPCFLRELHFVVALLAMVAFRHEMGNSASHPGDWVRKHSGNLSPRGDEANKPSATRRPGANISTIRWAASRPRATGHQNHRQAFALGRRYKLVVVLVFALGRLMQLSLIFKRKQQLSILFN